MDYTKMMYDTAIMALNHVICADKKDIPAVVRSYREHLLDLMERYEKEKAYFEQRERRQAVREDREPSLYMEVRRAL